MKTIGFILFIMVNGLFASVLAFVEHNGNNGASGVNSGNVVIDISNRFLETAGVGFQSSSMIDVVLVFVIMAVFFLIGIYLIFEIFLFLNFMGSRNKKYLK